MSNITELPFVKTRIELLTKERLNPKEQQQKADRTTKLVQKWLDLAHKLQGVGAATISCCMARPGKAEGSASLVVIDKTRFDALQTEFQASTEESSKVESAIHSIGDVWFADLSNDVAGEERTIIHSRRRIAESLATVQARLKIPPEEATLHEEYLKHRVAFDNDILNAEARLSELRPELARVRGLLEAAGC